MAVAEWLYELGELKRIARSGWWTAKVRQPETVAEHSWRAACIAYALALEEGLDAPAAAVAALFHDAHEARTLDLHKMAKKYVRSDAIRAAVEQNAASPAKTRLELDKPIPSAIKTVVKDADLLEMAVTAQEYMAAGHVEARAWRDGVKAKLATKTAKKWYGEIRRTQPSEWYRKN
ncbi:HD domain-containing protein [Candidatus Micrarchaeota archaeon]|nr:HD domain-containing protein [Candidatus Micrarchaeota archaeon]